MDRPTYAGNGVPQEPAPTAANYTVELRPQTLGI
jgi:hypothetical protein